MKVVEKIENLKDEIRKLEELFCNDCQECFCSLCPYHYERGEQTKWMTAYIEVQRRVSTVKTASTTTESPAKF